jgi:hypothetical protein
MRPLIDLTGRKFGRLSVIAIAQDKSRHGQMQWACSCSCGAQKVVSGDRLRQGVTRSCGCLLRQIRTKHGHSRCDAGNQSATYRSWASMKTRCLNPNNRGFKYYGGRGITICERWMLFVNFLADMGERPPGKTLDRIDVDGNYEPGNCRWATPLEQIRNRRRRRRRNLLARSKSDPRGNELRAILRSVAQSLRGPAPSAGAA